MKSIFSYVLLIAVFFSCKGKEESAAAELPAEASTPVTITTVGNVAMEESVTLNATSTFLQKWIVRANATGYLKMANVQLNKMVGRGQTLYTVKTKEAESIGNTINILDSSFRFSGVNSIRANGSGFISQIDKQPGDYVQWDPRELFYLHDWNVVFVPDGSDLQQVIAAQRHGLVRR